MGDRDLLKPLLERKGSVFKDLKPLPSHIGSVCFMLCVQVVCPWGTETCSSRCWSARAVCA
jgi:hypothetical protein